MDYALAQELKDAGFPQHREGKHNDRCMAFQPCIPTLEELIEELQKDGHVYTIICYAHGFVIARDGLDDMRICGTPIKAVARLWLALNKK